MAEINLQKYYRVRDVMAMLGVSRACLYLWMKKGTFPKPVKLGEKAVAWRAQDLANWQASH